MKKDKKTDVEVVHSGWWCPVFKAVFPNKCSHAEHDPRDSFRCLVVTNSGAVRAERRKEKKP